LLTGAHKGGQTESASRICYHNAMTVHFICRGNVFRSIIAEAYLRSLRLKGVDVLSSGTVAAKEKSRNEENHYRVRAMLKRHGIERFAKPAYGEQATQSLIDKSTIIVCVNRRVYEECSKLVKLPDDVVVWNVADIDEAEPVPATARDREQFLEKTYLQIVDEITKLVQARQLQKVKGESEQHVS